MSSSSSLLTATWEYLCGQSQHAWGLAMSFVAASVIELCTWAVLKRTDAFWFLPLYCGLYVAELRFHRHVVFHRKLNTKHAVENAVLRQGWSEYEQLSLADKRRIHTDDFRSKLHDARDAVSLTVDWGLHECFVVIKMIAIMMFVSGQRGSLVAMAMGSGVVYFSMFKDAESMFRTQHKAWKKDIRAQNRSMRQRTDLLLYGHTDTEDVNEVLARKSDLQKTSDTAWNNMASSIDVTNIANLILLLLFNQQELTNPVDTVILLTSFTRLSTATKWLLRFLHSYQRGQDTFEEYHNLFRETAPRPLPPQIRVPSELVVREINVTIGDTFHLHMTRPLTLRHGDRLLITGPSGGGKSTFLHALQGRVEGAVLDGGEHPSVYLSEYVELNDSLRNITLAEASIRSLCLQRKSDVFDQALAIRCLEMCCADEVAQRFAVDDNMSNALSTGEKSRVVLALLVLYPLLHRHHRCLILDEPEAGMDPPLAYRVLNNILTSMECSTKIIVVVSHLEKVREACTFQRSLRVNDGDVTLSN